MSTRAKTVDRAEVPILGQPTRPLIRLFSREVAEIGQHTLAFVAAISSIWIVHLVLEYLLGEDANFYDRIPVRYVTDTGHLAVLVRFVWQLVLQIGRKR
jgi:hypothetical protein